MEMSAAHVSHGRAAESLEAKAQWFQSLTLEERMEYLCEMTDLIIENNPRILEQRHTEPVAGRIRVLKLAEL